MAAILPRGRWVNVTMVHASGEILFISTHHRPDSSTSSRRQSTSSTQLNHRPRTLQWRNIWHLKTLVTWLFVQQFVTADKKNTSIFCITGPLWRESTSNHWFPSQSNCCAESVSKSWYRKLGPFYPYPSGMLQRHWENCKIAQVPVKQPWRIWMNNSYEFTKKLYQWLSARLQYLHC